MKKLYCMNCGTEIKGGIPNECSCGAEFDLADTKNIKRIITSVNYFICFAPDSRYFLVSYRTNYFSSSWVSNYDEH